MCSCGNGKRSVRCGGKYRSVRHMKISEIQTGIFWSNGKRPLLSVKFFSRSPLVTFFPLLPSVGCLPSLAIGYIFSRACYRFDCIPAPTIVFPSLQIVFHLCWFERSLGFKVCWLINYFSSVFDVILFGFAPIISNSKLKPFNNFSN